MYKVKRFVRKSKDVVDFVSYAVFLLLFTFVALNANPGEDLIEQNRAVRTAITEQEFFFNTSHVRKDFYDIDGVDEFWKWMRGPLPATLLSESFPDQRGFFYRYLRVLGQIRLRQVRVGSDSCAVPALLQEYGAECYAPFSAAAEDREAYGPSDGLGQRVWRWWSAAELREGSYVGRSWVTYPGSGFNVTLPTDRASALERLAFLQDNRWVDLRTRAVFLDMLIYNANTRLVTLVKAVVEFPPASGCIPFLVLRTAPLSALLPSLNSPAGLAAELAILVQVCLYVVKEVGSMRINGWSYWREAWHYFDWINYVAFLAAFYLRLQPYYFIDQASAPAPLCLLARCLGCSARVGCVRRSGAGR